MSFWRTLREDIEAVFERDPAARNVLEVVLTYSGLHAIWIHRIAHPFGNGNFARWPASFLSFTAF